MEQDQLTRAQKALLALTGDVARQLAEEHGVCVRPLALRRIDLTSGKVDVVPVPCGARREDLCKPCAEKNRRLRMVQCREGWHLEHEPIARPADPSSAQKELMATRADLHAAYQLARLAGDEDECDQIRDAVEVVDGQLRGLGVRGRLEPLDPPDRPARKRSTRRRQDAPNLPRRPVEKRTLGRVFGEKYRPSTFLTLTLDSYGRVDGDGAALDPDRYDYRRAARDAIHFPAVLDRFWQNTRRCVGWEVQYFGTIEPQRRGAPHFHAAIRGSIPRAELRAIAAATYHQVWWPAHDEIRYSGDRVPRWDDRSKGFVDPDTRTPLPTWQEATDPANLPAPAHTVRFGAQVHVKGILGGTEEAGRHIGYLTKYLTKDVAHAAGLADDASDRQRRHRDRLVAELRITPCSPRCGVWLLYGVQPQGARLATVPGVCKGKAHMPEHLGIAGRRVLVSRKWSGKTLDDHRAERAAFVRQLLDKAGVRPGYAVDDGPFEWEKTKPGDPDVPTRPALLLAAISERQRWKADYDAAQLAAGDDPPENRSATTEEAA
ncbi:MAG: replication initiator protein [Pseudonocardia sp. 73-21]|nr:MAG: replication initiator protein [Pseudonocardia sp. 73-21]